MRHQGTNLGELYRRWGRTVFEAHGVLFTNVDPGSRVFTPVVDHGDFHLTREQGSEILRQGRGLVLRYPTLTQNGLPGGAYVCTDAAYDLGHLTKRMRNYVRRGLQACEIRPLEQEELRGLGLRLNQETDGRHGRARPEFCEAARWEATAAAALESPGAFALGAFAGGELASYQIGVRDGEWVYAVIQMSRTDLLDAHPNHALDFYFNRWAFAQPGVTGVSIGPVPLRVNEGLHSYKVRMGFGVDRRNVALRLHPALGMVAGSGLTAWAVERARQWAPVRERAAMRERLEGLELVIRGSRITARESAVEFGPLAVPERETT